MSAQIYDIQSGDEIMVHPVRLPKGLSLEPPCKPRGLKPWSEVQAAYLIATDFAELWLDHTPSIVGKSLRAYAGIFDWGQNGHNLVAKTVKKLGLSCAYCNKAKATTWSLDPISFELENQQKTSEKPAKARSHKGFRAVKNQRKTSKKPALPKSHPKKPAKARSHKGFRAMKNQPRVGARDMVMVM